jgi:hypothetical protein
MTSIHLKTHAGPVGTVNLWVPTEFRETDLDVLVVLQPVAETGQTSTADAQGWPTGFIEETYGSFRDEPLVRPPQGKADPGSTLESG